MKQLKKKQMTNMPSRFLWADCIRIVAIYLVLYIHTSIQANAPSLGLLSVPLFVMLSGALLLGKQESYGSFFKKRCIKILIPWIAWTVIYLFVDYQFFHKSKDEILSAHFVFQTFMSNLWFLPLIFSLYLITPFLRIFVQHAKQKDLLYIIVLWFLFLSVLPVLVPSVILPHWEPSVVFTTIQYSGYYLLGYLLIQKKLSQRTWWQLIILFLFGIGCVLVSTGFLDPRTVVASIAIFCFFILFSNYLEHHVHAKLRIGIILVSKASFGVYLIHPLIIDLVGKQFTLVIFLVSILVVIFLQRIPILKYLVP